MPGRNPQLLGIKGSLAWTQALVNDRPGILNAAIASAGLDTGDIEWVSPLRSDDYAEYRDGAFLDRLGICLARHPLQAFWPSGGPQWDALAKTGTGVLLVEAKAHLPELRSACAAGTRSIPRIRESLALVRQALGAEAGSDWTAPYYQYANRLAHLYLLRELNGLNAELVMLCFLNDRRMGGPSSAEEWLDGFARVHRHLGIPRDSPPNHVHHVFVDVAKLPEAGDSDHRPEAPLPQDLVTVG